MTATNESFEQESRHWGVRPIDPIRDPRRLRALGRLNLEALKHDPILREIVAEASERLGLPVSLVSLVLDQAQIFPAHTGLTGWLARVEGTPIEWSFCANAVRSESPFVVEDATQHPAVKDIPLVEQDDIRCYAGIPLRAPDGSILGTLCAIGPEPRTFTAGDLATLQQLADQAASRIAKLAW
jgi:GAF domain-containing protein